VSLDAVERKWIADAVAEARDAGVSEAVIEAEIAEQLADGENIFATVAICGHLRHFARGGHRPRPPASECPTRPPTCALHEW
jgi:hypothetical protein